MDGKGQIADHLCSLCCDGYWIGSFLYAKSSSQTEKENLVIAGKLGPEPEILANMYKILIEENTDMTVTVKPNFGKTTFLYEALKKGDIAIYPEFTGTVTESLLKPAPQVSHDPEAVYKAARDGIKETRRPGLAQTHGLSKYLCCCSA